MEVQRQNRLTVREVAQLMGVSTDSVRRWIRLGWLPASQLRPRSSIRIAESDLISRLRPWSERSP